MWIIHKIQWISIKSQSLQISDYKIEVSIRFTILIIKMEGNDYLGNRDIIKKAISSDWLLMTLSVFLDRWLQAMASKFSNWKLIENMQLRQKWIVAELGENDNSKRKKHRSNFINSVIDKNNVNMLNLFTSIFWTYFAGIDWQRTMNLFILVWIPFYNAILASFKHISYKAFECIHK